MGKQVSWLEIWKQKWRDDGQTGALESSCAARAVAWGGVRGGDSPEGRGWGYASLRLKVIYTP